VQFGPVNWLAIAVSVIANFVIGGLWYSPVLFVRPWLRMSGVDKPIFDAGLPKALLGDLFSAIVIAIVLNQVMRWSGAIGLASGLLVSVVVWVGFVASVLLTQVTYEHRPFAFFAISAGYRFVTLIAMGIVLSIWR
jgi:Protein of unknown function (DUF1761)